MRHRDRPVVAVVGAGFAGLWAARELSGKDVDVVVLDRHNYHTFFPLLYQVAMAGLEPSSISFPLRKIFQNKKNIFVRIANVAAMLAMPHRG